MTLQEIKEKAKSPDIHKHRNQNFKDLDGKEFYVICSDHVGGSQKANGKEEPWLISKDFKVAYWLGYQL